MISGRRVIRGVVYADSFNALAIANREGAGKLRHIHISTLWIQEKQDLHQLEMRKDLGRDNPADLMIKYLTRSAIDTHPQFMGHHRADGRAQAGLQVQGKTASAEPGRVVGSAPTTTTPQKARVRPKTALCFSEGRGSDIRGTRTSGASPPAYS